MASKNVLAGYAHFLLVVSCFDPSCRLECYFTEVETFQTRAREMPKLHVTLSEVLQALGGPLEEPALWALLHQASATVQMALAGRSPTCFHQSLAEI